MKFDSYHPIINFIYIMSVIVCTITFQHPVFLVIAYVAAFVWSVKLKGKKALIFNLILIPCILLYMMWYASYNHFGLTVLWYNRIGNRMTLEAFVYGFVRGTIAATVIMELSCVFATVTTDKIVYLLGRVSPNLSLFFSILLRFVPRMKAQSRKIDIARQGVGHGIGQGNIFQRVWHLLAVISITITWAMEHLIESAMSMKSRGYSLKKRTAFSIYRFDNRDRCFIIVMVFCIMVTYVGYAIGETMMYYDPELILHPMTGVSMLFYVIYAILLFLPVTLQIIVEKRFDKLRENFGL